MTPDEVSRMLETRIPQALLDWDNNRARSREKTSRKLGMSDLGGCREFIRATLAGDEGIPETALKWPAFVGTALGELVERALHEEASASTQKWVTVTLPRTGIQASGNTDVVLDDDHLIDLKTKAYLEDVAKEGPTLQQWVQVSGYFVGLVQAGHMTKDGTASLVFLDRSGNNPKPVAFTIGYDDAIGYLEAAEDRLDDVALALEYPDQDRSHLRDQPESWCHYVQCPFRQQCWGDEYEPLEQIDNPELIKAMGQYDAGRVLAKQAKAMQAEGKSALGGYGDEPVSGETDTFTLRWKQGSYGWTIDLRKKR